MSWSSTIRISIIHRPSPHPPCEGGSGYQEERGEEEEGKEIGKGIRGQKRVKVKKININKK